jgi:hypothetical protein
MMIKTCAIHWPMKQKSLLWEECDQISSCPDLQISRGLLQSTVKRGNTERENNFGAVWKKSVTLMRIFYMVLRMKYSTSENIALQLGCARIRCYFDYRADSVWQIIPCYNRTEATSLDLKISSVWQIPVFRYGLLMRNRGYIEFETLEKQCWSNLRNIKTAIN